MRPTFVFALALAGAFFTSSARAESFVLPPASDDPVHQCHNPHVGGGSYQIDWDYLGFDQDTGNPHGALHISGETNTIIRMSNQSFQTGFTDPPTGNYEQQSFIFSSSGEGATFNFEDILSVTLQSEELIDLRGTTVEMGQMFTLTIQTTSNLYVFDLESIMGSHLNFNSRSHFLTGANLRFCGDLREDIPPPPPVIPEPTTLFGVGLAILGALRARKK